jgi:hypothetical protein
MKREVQVDNVDELIKILSKKNHSQAYTIAKANKTCVICNQKATKFSTLKAEFEYNNSAICEICHMKYFG